MAVEPGSDRRVWVLGGGVVGLACAFELAERGLPVTVVERETVGSGAGCAAAGMLAAVAEAETDAPAVTVLARASVALYPDFVRRVEAASGMRCGFREEGSLWVAVTRDDAAHLEHLQQTLDSKGLPYRDLSGKEVLALEPHLSGRVQRALALADDRQVDPRRLTAALARALVCRGATILEHSTAERLTPAPDGDGFSMKLKTAAGPQSVRAHRLLVTAGAHSTPLIAGLGSDLTVRPVKGQLLRLRGGILLQRVVRTPDVYLVPRDDGELLIGATVEEMGFDERPTAGAVLDLLRYAWQVLPGIYDLHLSEISVGLRPATGDHRPSIGETRHAGAFVALGHFRNGVLLAPATAHYLAEWIADGTRPAELAAFVPGSGEGV